jgi:uncharacterized protein YutE (UPF0331/DUF86 family)
MTDAEIVLRKLAAAREHVARARRRRPEAVDVLLADDELQDELCMSLLVAIQESIDIAFHIAADEGWGVHASNAEAFELLARNGVMTAELAREMGNAASLRNRIVHGYATVDFNACGLRFRAYSMGWIGSWQRSRSCSRSPARANRRSKLPPPSVFLGHPPHRRAALAQHVREDLTAGRRQPRRVAVRIIAQLAGRAERDRLRRHGAVVKLNSGVQNRAPDPVLASIIHRGVQYSTARGRTSL